jgi:hypothetical protein
MSTKTLVHYIIPNFEIEWPDAQKYFEFQQMGKKNWMNFAKNSGKRIKFKEIQENFQTTDLPKDLNGNKKEMPIIIKFSEENYEIIGGKERLEKMTGDLEDLFFWQIDLSNLMFSI